MDTVLKQLYDEELKKLSMTRTVPEAIKPAVALANAQKRLQELGEYTAPTEEPEPVDLPEPVPPAPEPEGELEEEEEPVDEKEE